MRFQEFCDLVLDMPREMAAEAFTKPDDDWLPMMFVNSGDDRITPMALVGPFDTAEDKELFARYVVPEMLKLLRAEKCALMLNGVSRSFDLSDPEQLAQAKRMLDQGIDALHADPKQREVLSMQVSDGTRNREWEATITRWPNDPPTLGEWEQVDVEGTAVMGRLTGVLMDAFRIAAMEEG